MKLWRVKSRSETDFIRANSLDDASAEFFKRHGHKAIEFQPTDYRVFAVYFSDSSDPAYFKGTKKNAIEGGRLYIKQWQLDATITSVQEL